MADSIFKKRLNHIYNEIKNPSGNSLLVFSNKAFQTVSIFLVCNKNNVKYIAYLKARRKNTYKIFKKFLLTHGSFSQCFG